MSGYSVKSRNPISQGLMNRSAARVSDRRARRGVRVATLLLPVGPGVVEGLLRLLLALGERLLGRLLAVEHPVDSVLPGRLELVARRVRGHRERVVVGLVGRLDRGLPLGVRWLDHRLDLLVGLDVAGEDPGEDALALAEADSLLGSLDPAAGLGHGLREPAGRLGVFAALGNGPAGAGGECDRAAVVVPHGVEG